MSYHFIEMVLNLERIIYRMQQLKRANDFVRAITL